MKLDYLGYQLIISSNKLLGLGIGVAITLYTYPDQSKSIRGRLEFLNTAIDFILVKSTTIIKYHLVF